MLKNEKTENKLKNETTRRKCKNKLIFYKRIQCCLKSVRPTLDDKIIKKIK